MGEYRLSNIGDRQLQIGHTARFSQFAKTGTALLTTILLVSLAGPADAQIFWPSEQGNASARMERKRVRYARNRTPKVVEVKETTKPVGPIVISISIEKQQLKLHDTNGVFAESPVSTGTATHPTPMGVFSVIGKEVFHRSNIYSGAPMPHMQRITWSGVAMHAGALPGYPASHGCIRLPAAFASRLYGWTKMGARVVITPGELSPSEFAHPLLVTSKPSVPDPNAPVAMSDAKDKPATIAEASATSATIADLKLTSGTGKGDETRKADEVRTADASGAVPAQIATSDTKSEPKLDKDQAKSDADKSASRPVPGMAEFIGPVKPRSGQIAAFVSRKTNRLYVRQNFEPLFDVPVTIAASDRPLGTHIFTVKSDDNSKLQWVAVSLPTPPARAAKGAGYDRRGRKIAAVPASTPATPLSASEALDKITIPEDAMKRIVLALAPGGSITVSDHGLGDETGKGTDFIVPLRDPSITR